MVFVTETASLMVKGMVAPPVTVEHPFSPGTGTGSRPGWYRQRQRFGTHRLPQQADGNGPTSATKGQQPGLDLCAGNAAMFAY